jgi:hypothetical protein
MGGDRHHAAREGTPEVQIVYTKSSWYFGTADIAPATPTRKG